MKKVLILTGVNIYYAIAKFSKDDLSDSKTKIIAGEFLVSIPTSRPKSYPNRKELNKYLNRIKRMAEHKTGRRLIVECSLITIDDRPISPEILRQLMVNDCNKFVRLDENGNETTDTFTFKK